MIITGKLINKEMTATINKKGGGTYPGWRLTLQDESGEIDQQVGHENGLKYDKALENSFNNLTVGEIISIVKEKEDGFWNVKSVCNGVMEGSEKTTAKFTGGKSVDVQDYIIRQSSIASAIKYHSITRTAPTAATTEDVLATAQHFVDFVYNKQPFDEIKNDIPQ